MPTWEEIEEENKHRFNREQNHRRRREEQERMDLFDSLRYRLHNHEREKHNLVKNTIKELIDIYNSKTWKLELDYTEKKQNKLFEDLSTGEINQHYFLMYGWSLNEAKEKIEQLKKNLNEDPPSKEKRIANLQEFDKELPTVEIVEQFFEEQMTPLATGYRKRDPRWREGLSVEKQLELQNKSDERGEPLSYEKLEKEKKMILLEKDAETLKKEAETLKKETETLEKEIKTAQNKGAKALTPDERREIMNKITEYTTKKKEFEAKQKKLEQISNQIYRLVRSMLGGKRRTRGKLRARSRVKSRKKRRKSRRKKRRRKKRTKRRRRR